MSQCQKILDNGERCSNQATPGTSFCNDHGKARIVFRPVGKPADTAPPPRPPRTEPPSGKGRKERRKAKPVRLPEWRAAPCAIGQAPSFPGLSRDERNLLVAPQGLIWLEATPGSVRGGVFDRLVRLLSLLSQTMDLPSTIRLLRRGEEGDCLVFLSPDQNEDRVLSLIYDAISSAARLVEGRLYIGQGQGFIQYRDDRAPGGYDARRVEVPQENDQLLLVARWGSRTLRVPDFAPVRLDELILGIAPQPAAGDPSPEEIFVLTPVAFYPLLARYFRAHRLRFEVARLGAAAVELALLQVGPREASTGQRIPSFILDYLSRFPRVTLLVPGHQAEAQRILVQWQHRHPLHLPHVSRAFAPTELVLLQAAPYSNMRADPAPQFFDGDRVTNAHLPGMASLTLASLRAEEAPEIRLPILLRPDPGPTPSIGAVILSVREVGWLRRLLYRLPGEVYSYWFLALGEDRAVLLGQESPIDGIPFGEPLRRHQGSHLFLPLRHRFVPDLPWTLVQQAMKLRDGVYTFLTEEYRLDLPATDFVPLSRLLTSDPARPGISLKIVPMAPPELRWKTPLPPELAGDESGRNAGKAGVLGQIQGLFRSGRRRGEAHEPGEGEARPDLNVYLRQQAQAFEQQEDFLAAAVCFSMVQDPLNSARCYRKAADLLGKQGE